MNILVDNLMLNLTNIFGTVVGEVLKDIRDLIFLFIFCN